MRHFKAVKWVSLILSLAICLMGISYSAHTDHVNILNMVKTGDMDYIFDIGGNTLKIELDTETSNELLHLQEGGEYLIPYRLKNDGQDNIPMQKIDNMLIGEITISLKEMFVIKDGESTLLPSDIPIGIPDSLGTFQCYHDYDGENGTIKLIKKSQPKESELTVNIDDLPSMLREQLAGNSSTSETHESKTMEDDEELTGDVVEYIETTEEVGTLMITGNYSFEIELGYNQFNANID